MTGCVGAPASCDEAGNKRSGGARGRETDFAPCGAKAVRRVRRAATISLKRSQLECRKQ